MALARAHACQGTEQLNASRLAAKRGGSRLHHPSPPAPPLFPWLLMLPRCASLGFPDSRVPALDHVLPAMRFSHRLPDGCSSTARGDFLGKLSHLS